MTIGAIFQQTVDYCYRLPRSQFRKIRRFGGLAAYLSMQRGRKQMEKAALELPATFSSEDGLPLYFLTGERYLYQTLFCIRSLSMVSSEKFRITLVDDGSFNTGLINLIQKLLPGARVITAQMIADNLDRLLPQDRFPVLHHKRAVYPHIRKLTDIHTLNGDPWKLVLDSDMLFWHEPSEIIDWLRSGDKKTLILTDCVQSYGYSTALMAQLCGESIRGLLNVGAVGLKSAQIDWQKLEEWIPVLEGREGTSYYLEQALTAMIIGDADVTVLSAQEYIVGPDLREGHERRGKLHHYVDLSKKIYFTDLWRKIAH